MIPYDLTKPQPKTRQALINAYLAGVRTGITAYASDGIVGSGHRLSEVLKDKKLAGTFGLDPAAVDYLRREKNDSSD